MRTIGRRPLGRSARWGALLYLGVLFVSGPLAFVDEEIDEWVGGTSLCVTTVDPESGLAELLLKTCAVTPAPTPMLTVLFDECTPLVAIQPGEPMPRAPLEVPLRV